ncbi:MULTISPECIES: hypothetical protein [unclassified Pseudomonas]|uniref:hypothetical protein n=1 Tax=unclassified Pseudomonas TaxID=196821 RepID=UPI001BB37D12|nr:MULTISPECIES: hypothetical protein [unclassified Pseudomonas]
MTVELGGWREVTLTLAGSPSFIEMFVAKFSEPPTWGAVPKHLASKPPAIGVRTQGGAFTMRKLQRMNGIAKAEKYLDAHA